MTEYQNSCCKSSLTCKALTALLLLQSIENVDARKRRRRKRRQSRHLPGPCREGHDLARALCSAIPWDDEHTSANQVLNACNAGENTFNKRWKKHKHLVANICQVKGSKKKQLKEDMNVCKQVFKKKPKDFCKWMEHEMQKPRKPFSRGSDDISKITKLSKPHVPDDMKPKYVARGDKAKKVDTGKDETELNMDIGSVSDGVFLKPESDSFELETGDSWIDDGDLKTHDERPVGDDFDPLDVDYGFLEDYLDDSEDIESLHELAVASKEIQTGFFRSRRGIRLSRRRRSRRSRRSSGCAIM